MTDRQIVLPSGWYLGAHGDPVAIFDDASLILVLHDDGRVTWSTKAGLTPRTCDEHWGRCDHTETAWEAHVCALVHGHDGGHICHCEASS